MSDEKQGLETVPEESNGNEESGYESDHCSMEARDSMDSFFTVRLTSVRQLENSDLENSQPNSSKSQKTEEGDHHMNLSSVMDDHIMNLGDHLRNLKSPKGDHDHHMNLSSLMGDHHINLNDIDTGVGEGSRDLYPLQAYTEDFRHAKEITPRNSTEIMNYKPCCMPLRAKKTGAKPNSPPFVIHANQKREEKLGLRATLVQRMCFARKSSESKLPV